MAVPKKGATSKIETIKNFVNSKPKGWGEADFAARKRMISEKTGIDLRYIHTLSSTNKDVKAVLQGGLQQKQRNGRRGRKPQEEKRQGGNGQSGEAQTEERQPRHPVQWMTKEELSEVLRNMDIYQLRDVRNQANELLREKLEDLKKTVDKFKDELGIESRVA